MLLSIEEIIRFEVIIPVFVIRVDAVNVGFKADMCIFKIIIFRFKNCIKFIKLSCNC